MKKIIIGIPSLRSGGVEVSLIRFLNELCKNRDYDITLLMLKKEGLYLDSVPKNIRIIEVDYLNYIYDINNKLSDLSNVNGLFNKVRFLFYRLRLRKCLNDNDWAKYYKIVLSKVKDIDGNFDLAIDWHGYGHFISALMVDKISSKRRITWVHDERVDWLYKIEQWLDNYDKIFCVGKSCMNSVLGYNNDLLNKTDVLYNLVDYKNIRKMANMECNIKFDNKKCNIITVGRLENQKGYDIAIQSAKVLKDKNFNFCWYFVGDGVLRDKLKMEVVELGLTDNIKFLGIVKNPFPLVKRSDLFVLSSRHEGYCLAILEAKILSKVIIATDIESNKEQITDEVNGLLCELDYEKFANKIIDIYENKDLRDKIVSNLKHESFDYTDELKKIYELME